MTDETRLRREVDKSLDTSVELRRMLRQYSVPTEVSVASLRTLGAAATTAEVRQFLITLVRDLQQGVG